MEERLKAEHLYKAFERRHYDAVNDVTFSLYKGEILGLAGVSGSGKSTIARLLTGLLTPDQGKIYFEETCLTSLTRKEKGNYAGKIQMVFQNPVSSFDPRETLGKGIGEYFYNKGQSKQEIHNKVSQLLQTCLLREEYANKYPDEVSGGQCQRAAIARALASDPDILVSDEACSALDEANALKILQVYKQLSKTRNLSILFISHDMVQIQHICDRILILEKGKIIEEGETSRIFNNPRKEYTKELIAASETY